ncbi:hypothetical protein [Rhizobium sp. LjRoot254]|uniref:hypothetical protein n=1 Tax=Rhizobium sp. LjRoot254 TaxID=3342297 RepID=UPI003ED14785
MSNATLWIRPMPRRLLSEREAAEYLGVPVKRFHGLGISPIELVPGVRNYDIHDLDARVDLVKAGSGDPDDDVLGRLS